MELIIKNTINVINQKIIEEKQGNYRTYREQMKIQSGRWIFFFFLLLLLKLFSCLCMYVCLHMSTIAITIAGKRLNSGFGPFTMLDFEI